MRKIIFLFFIFCNSFSLQAQSEGQIRMEYPDESSSLPNISVATASESLSKDTNPKQNISSIETKPLKVSVKSTKKSVVRECTAIRRNLKIQKVQDTLPQSKKSLRKLGCFLREPLELISLGVEMFELTKPPKSPFLIILYVIYIIPLFAIIASFIVGGIFGLVSFILACGLFAFLLYWLTLFLLGIALAGNLILWGVGIAFVLGLILYILLIRLC